MVAATLARRKPADGLRAVDVIRDLGAIADLLELCFGAELDGAGWAKLREMRSLSRGRPFLWLMHHLRVIDPLGFVWTEGGQIVGNVTAQQAPAQMARGPGWMVFNVAVHPDHRRRGIGRAMMEAALAAIAGRGGRWVALQVKQDNEAALKLYRSLGFRELAAFTHWSVSPGRRMPPLPSERLSIGARRSGEWQAELALAKAARPQGLGWMQPVREAGFRPALLASIREFLDGKRHERWVVRDGERLIASLWVSTRIGRRTAELTLLVHPDWKGQVELPLLAYGLDRVRGWRRWARIEHPAGDPAAAAALRHLGFEAERTLVHMLWTRP